MTDRIPQVIILNSELLDESTLINLAELCRICDVHAELIEQLVGAGFIEPLGSVSAEWQFRFPETQKIKSVMRLQQDLEMNLAGAMMVVEMSEEMRRLRNRIAMLEKQLFLDDEK